VASCVPWATNCIAQNGCLLSLAQNLLSFSLLIQKCKFKVYRTVILRFVLYGSETWSLTLRKERRLRVFENRGAEENIWA
jgi:hypothetical protein